MPPGFQRYLPLVLIAVLLLFVLPALLKKHSSGPSSKTQSTQTIEAVNLIDQAEQAWMAAHQRYTASLSDLVAQKPKLAEDLVLGIAVVVDAGTGGQSYLQRVANANLSLVRSRTGGKLVANTCVVIKSASGVACPAT